MIKEYNVFSAFDGMSNGRIALDRASIPVGLYFASEVDRFAMNVTRSNYPDTIFVGDISTAKIPPYCDIDLLLGGSPCQGFSFAGKQLNFNDPRSKLFFEFVRVLRELSPKWFLMENVVMKQEFQDVISKELGVEPVLINSSLVSAQNRKRLYWTNIPVTQPEDKHIVLRDILDEGVTERDKAYCLTATYGHGQSLQRYTKKQARQLVFRDTECLSRCLQVGYADINGLDSIKRVYSPKGKCPTLTSCGGGHREPKVAVNESEWRKLTPTECERLQTVPEGYTEGVSNSQRYKMLGNGWTVDVIAHILSCIPEEG